MRRLLVVMTSVCFAVSASLTVFSALAEPVDPGKSPVTAPEIEQKRMDKAREVACGCCQKCMAAMKPVNPGEEKGTPATGGCKDCCLRCGKVKLPLHESIPPEVIKEK